MEQARRRGEQVVIVGGGDSAGQAAVFLVSARVGPDGRERLRLHGGRGHGGAGTIALAARAAAVSARDELPRVFAAGDVRASSTKRVASAVGEGSVVVQFIHRLLERGGRLAGTPSRRGSSEFPVPALARDATA